MLVSLIQEVLNLVVFPIPGIKLQDVFQPTCEKNSLWLVSQNQDPQLGGGDQRTFNWIPFLTNISVQ